MRAEKQRMGYHQRKIGEISPKIAVLSCRVLARPTKGNVAILSHIDFERCDSFANLNFFHRKASTLVI